MRRSVRNGNHTVYGSSGEILRYELVGAVMDNRRQKKADAREQRSEAMFEAQLTAAANGHAERAAQAANQLAMTPMPDDWDMFYERHPAECFIGPLRSIQPITNYYDSIGQLVDVLVDGRKPNDSIGRPPSNEPGVIAAYGYFRQVLVCESEAFMAFALMEEWLYHQRRDNDHERWQDAQMYRSIADIKPVAIRAIDRYIAHGDDDPEVAELFASYNHRMARTLYGESQPPPPAGPSSNMPPPPKVASIGTPPPPRTKHARF